MVVKIHRNKRARIYSILYFTLFSVIRFYLDLLALFACTSSHLDQRLCYIMFLSIKITVVAFVCISKVLGTALTVFIPFQVPII